MIHPRGKDLTIVAEISCNHKGDLADAKRLIELAKVSGADAVKIQVYDETEMAYGDPLGCEGYKIRGTKWDGQNLFELYKKTRTPAEWVEPLFDHAQSVGIPIFSSVFSAKGLEALERVGCPAYKIAAFEADHLQLLRAVHKTNKQMFVSVSNIHDADDVISLQEFKAKSYRESKENKLVVMHCTSAYPTERKHARLDYINSLKSLFPVVGYSDHNRSLRVAEYAAVLGAQVIERHLTIGGETEDAEFSLNPAQFKLYSHNIRRALESMTLFVPDDQEREHKQFKRTVYAIQDIKFGEAITDKNTAALRGNIEHQDMIKAYQYPDILETGYKAQRPIYKGERITWPMIMWKTK